MDKDGNTPLHDTARYGHQRMAPRIIFALRVKLKIVTQLFTMLLGMDTSTLPLYCLTVERMLRVKLKIVTQLFTMLLGMDTSTLPLYCLTVERMLRVKLNIMVTQLFAMLLGVDTSTLPLYCLTVRVKLKELHSSSQCCSESKTKDSYTALHNAARKGHLDVATLLLDRGADIESKTNAGKTPFQLAKNQEIRDILVERGAKDD